MNATTLMIGIITGSVGYVYYRYGKKRERTIMMFCGIGLIIYPYFIMDNVLALMAVGVALTLIPIFIKD